MSTKTIGLVFFSLMFFFGSTAVVNAETLTVTTMADSYDQTCDADCSLRDAAYWFNVHDNSETIIILPEGTFSIERYEVDPDYEKYEGTGDIDFKNTSSKKRSLILAGQGSEETILDGGDVSGVLQIDGVTSTISNLSIINGSAQESDGYYWDGEMERKNTFGGAMMITNAKVTITNCLFFSNNALTSGGAIYGEYYTLAVNNSVFQENHANNGGAISVGEGYRRRDAYEQNNKLTISNSVFENNSAETDGGAISGFGDFRLYIIDSTFMENSAMRNGGAIENWADCYSFKKYDFKVIRSNFDNNSAMYGGAIAYSSAQDEHYTMYITQSNFTNNTALYGGALYSTNDFGQPVGYINKSLFADNNATINGGAIYQTGNAILNITNVTMSGNNASNYGAALYNGKYSKYFISFSTITANASEAIANHRLAKFTKLKGSIISNNTLDGSSDTTTNCFSAKSNMLSMGYNVIDSETSCSGLVKTATDVFGSADLLELSDNGGPTQTHALLTNSLATDLIPEKACTDVSDNSIITTDQRKQVRPYNDRCDAGAYELTQESNN